MNPAFRKQKSEFSGVAAATPCRGWWLLCLLISVFWVLPVSAQITVLGKNPRDVVLPAFLTQGNNAQTIIDGLNLYAQQPVHDRLSSNLVDFVIGGAGLPGISAKGPPNTILVYDGNGNAYGTNALNIALLGNLFPSNVFTAQTNFTQYGVVSNSLDVLGLLTLDGLTASSLVMTGSGKALQSVTLGTGLSFSGSTLNSSGGGGAFIANLNGNGTNTTFTNFTFSGSGTNNGIVVTNSGTNVSHFLNYTLILTNMINDPFAGNGIAWVDVGGFSWQHAGSWLLNMTGNYDLAVAGSIEQHAETGTYTTTSSGTTSITAGTFAAIRLNAGFLNDYLSLNFQNNAMAMAGVPFLYDPWSNSGGNSNQVFQVFPFGSTYAATTSCGASNYLATVSQTNSIATTSGFMVYTNHNKEFVFNPGTNASKTLTYSQKGQSLDGSISYRTLTPGFIMVTNNGTSWGVATNISPVFVSKGFPTSVPTVLVSQDGIALWSTNASSTSHQCVVVGTLELMTR